MTGNGMAANRGADLSSDVKSPLTPVEAWPDERSRRRRGSAPVGERDTCPPE
jgi:hypothetical protein